MTRASGGNVDDLVLVARDEREPFARRVASTASGSTIVVLVHADAPAAGARATRPPSAWARSWWPKQIPTYGCSSRTMLAEQVLDVGDPRHVVVHRAAGSASRASRRTRASDVGKLARRRRRTARARCRAARAAPRTARGSRPRCARSSGRRGRRRADRRARVTGTRTRCRPAASSGREQPACAQHAASRLRRTSTPLRGAGSRRG